MGDYADDCFDRDFDQWLDCTGGACDCEDECTVDGHTHVSPASRVAYAVRKQKERDLALLKGGVFQKIKTEKAKMTTDTKTKKPLGPTDCLTPVFRASYLNAFEARAADPAKPTDKNYGVEMWFRVKDTPESLAAGETVVKIDDLIKAANAAAAEKWGVDATKWPKGLKNPFKKGEESTGKQGAIPGVIIVRCNRKERFGRPVVVDQNVKDIIDQKQVYSGCYMRAKIHAYAWEHPTGGKGVSFTLDMVQLVRDGEPLGNRMEAGDAFESLPLPGGAAAAAPAADAAGTFGALG